MNKVFNLPQDITDAGSNFAAWMFAFAGGSTFQVNGVFTFPAVDAKFVDNTDPQTALDKLAEDPNAMMNE